jgi:type VI secretion system secreted protein VgrG
MSSLQANKASLVKNVLVNSPLGPGLFQLQSCRYRESLGQPFQFDLELQSDDTAIDLDGLLGRPLTVKVRDVDGGDRFFSGLVRSVEQGGAEDQAGLYRLVVVPWISLLQLGSDCQIFQDKTALEIVEQVFADCGFSDFDAAALIGRYDPLPYRVQYNESHFDFVHRVLQAAGIYYFHEHGDGTHKLVLCDAPSAHKPFPGHARIPFRSLRNNALVEEHIHSLRVRQEIQPGGYATNDYDYTDPEADLKASDTATHSYPSGTFERFEYPGAFRVDDDRDAIATARLAESTCRSQEASGSAYSWGLSVGSVFSLDHYPRRDRNRSYLTTSIDLTIERADDESGSGSGSRAASGFTFRCDFTAIPSDVQFRPERTIRRPVIVGVQPALVVAPAGQDTKTPYTDKFATAKVQFYWDRKGKKDEKSSCWLRCMQFSAGNGWGSCFLPRVGGEVAVAFVDGDPDRPMILGHMYNSVNMPPLSLEKESRRSVIKDDVGNYLFMSSADGKEAVRIHTARNDMYWAIGRLNEKPE